MNGTPNAIVGIDPGEDTGVVVLGGDGRIRRHAEMSEVSIQAIEQVLEYIMTKIGAGNSDIVLAIEEQYVAVNIATTIKLVEARVRWEAIAEYRMIEVVRVHPKTWQSAFLKGSGAKKRFAIKQLARRVAQAIYPKEKRRIEAMTQNEVDALLIARYVWEQRCGALSVALDGASGSAR